MSILARSTRAPFGNSPAFMRRNRSRFSSTERSRNGLFLPGSVSVPRASADLLLRLVVDIGVAGLDQALGPVVQPLEIVGGVEEVGSPVVAEPVHVGLDGIDIFLLFLGRVGVVEAQMAAAGEFLRDAEIERDRLGVADVQIAVRLRRESGHDPAVLFGGEIGLDDVANEIAPRLCRYRFCGHYRFLFGIQADLLPNSPPSSQARFAHWATTLVMHRSCYTPRPSHA